MESLSNIELIQVRDLCELALGGDKDALATLRAKFGEIKTAADIWKISKKAFNQMDKATKEEDYALSNRRTATIPPQKPSVSPFTRLRLNANFTQAALAEAVGINIRHIQKIEAGEVSLKNITASTSSKLAAALGVTMEELMRQS